MKCPICGKTLRPSKKDPSYGLCDNCKKKFKLKKEEAIVSRPLKDSTDNPAKATARSKNPSTTTKNKKNKQKKKGGLLKFFLIFFLLVILAGAAYFFFPRKDDSANGDSDVPTRTSETTTNEGNALAYTETCNDIQISIINVTESQGNDLTHPSDGNIFYLCEFEIVNNSSADIAINSLSDIEAFCGDYSVSEDISGLLLTEADGKNSLDGTITSGQTFSGVVTYQIPDDYTQMQFRITPDFWNGESATFTIPKE